MASAQVRSTTSIAGIITLFCRSQTSNSSARRIPLSVRVAIDNRCVIPSCCILPVNAFTPR
uniref:Uncharacterized protein n=1 Tax=Yersinia enterocolitica TaxID=630 RepID=B0RL60_YEREN|nr:hypothetical protein [Yersinia enterocolitica]